MKDAGEMRRAVRGGMAAALCMVLAGGPLAEPMAAATVTKRAPTAGGPQLWGDARIEHALNRLTFGPRPGDVAAVKAMGLGAWFERQLNPGKIDDSALEARLAGLPAMQLPQAELLARYPSPEEIKRIAEAQTPMTLPADPVEHAIYVDQVWAYRMDREKKAAGDAASARKDRKAAGGDAAMGGDMASGDGSPAMAKPDGTAAAAADKHVEALYRELDAAKILSLPPEERMRRVVAMPGREFVAFRRSLSGAELRQLEDGLSPQERESLAAMQSSVRMVAGEEQQVRLLRDVYSSRQLEAVMTDFWLNHFNVYARKDQKEPYLIPAFERDAVRPHALGRFEDLLVATAESPAMLVYLDNQTSVGPDSKAARQGRGLGALMASPQARARQKDRGLNENYGRELMELHTLGVNGGYTQADVIAVAKVFTGWTVEPKQGSFEFRFDERRHEPGPKTVLGRKIEENGRNEGLEVLHMLASSPATAHFLCEELAVRFVSDDPPPALVERMAKAYLASDGEIGTVLRTMFESPEFWLPAAQRAKVKTPIEFVVSAVRASGATVVDAQGLATALDRLGMPLYGMQTPNGYSWKNDAWVSTGALVSRMNFALVLAGDRLPGTKTDWAKVLASAPAAKPGALKRAASEAEGENVDPEVAAKERKLELALLGGPVSERTRATVMAQSNDSAVAAAAAREFRVGKGARGGLISGVDGSQMPGGMGPARPAVADDRQAAVMAGLLLGSPEFQRR